MVERTFFAAVVSSLALIPACSFWGMDTWGDARGADAAGDAPDADIDDGGSSKVEAGISKYAAAVLLDSPIGYWRLDEASGTVAKDSSGTGADGTYASIGTALGAPGALPGDGTGVTISALAVGGGPIAVGPSKRFAFAGNAPFSIEAWVKPTMNDANFRHVVRRVQPSPRDGYSVWLHNGQVGIERFSNGDNTSIAATIPMNVFTHVVCTYNGSEANIYLNGAWEKRSPQPLAIADSDEPLNWGGGQKTDEFFPGTLDELAIYDKALTADQVAAHYTASK